MSTDMSFQSAKYEEEFPGTPYFATRPLHATPKALHTIILGSSIRRDPLTLRDRGGKKVELVTRPVPLGAHAFILITNTQAAAGNLQGLPSKGRFAMAQ